MPIAPPQTLYPVRLRDEPPDPDHVAEAVAARLRAHGLPDGFGRRAVVPHDEPELLEALHDAPRIVVRWIWLREWTVQVTGADGRPALRVERGPAVGSLVLDLATGRASLRVPDLPPNTLGGLPKQRRLLRSAVASVLDLDRFEPVSLEPVIRKALRSSRVEVLTWAVRVRGDRNLRGDGDPGLLRWIVWRLRRIEGRWVTCEWLPEGGAGSRVTTKLFAASDRVDLLEPCDEADLDRVLGELEGMSEAARPVAGLESPAGTASAPSPPPLLPEHGLLHVVRLGVRRFRSPERTERIVTSLAPWLFVLLYVPAVLLTTLAAAKLTRVYPESQALFLIAFLMCVVPLAALVEIGLGRPVAGRALRMVVAVSTTVGKLMSLGVELLLDGLKLLWRRWRRRRRVARP